MSKSQIFLGTLISFCLGIGIHPYFPYNPTWYGVSAIFLLCLAICLLLFSKRNPTPKSPPRDFSAASSSTTNNFGRNDKKSPPNTNPSSVEITKNRKLSTRPLLTAFFWKETNSPFSRGLGGAFRILTLLTFLSLGLYRAQSTIHIPTPETIDYYTQESSPSSPDSQSSRTLTGIIAEEPDVRRDKINYTVKVQTVSSPLFGREGKSESEGVSSLPLSGYTLISTGKFPKYEFGDQLKLTGNLQKPVVFDTFDYAGYLSRFDIYSVMYRPRIEFIESPPNRPYRPYLSYLFSIKQSFEQQLNKTYPTEPTSSFMAGLLLGSRKGMPDDLTADFQTTGLTHIVAISGYNITLVVSILMAIFKPFGKRISILLAALGIILFTLFVGATPAVVRACIMGLIALLALNSERKGNITIILALTASLMIGYNPKILIYDVGFQLSFLATMGLIYVSPILEPYLKRLPKKLAIRDSINLSLSAQIMALPIIVLNFQNLSLISPISNLLVAGPFIPFSMLFGFVGTMASYLSLALGKIIAFPGYLLLEYIIHMIEFTADIPFAAVTVSWFSNSMLFLYFIGLTGFLYQWWKKDQQREETIRKFQLIFEHRVVEQLWLKT